MILLIKVFELFRLVRISRFKTLLRNTLLLRTLKRVPFQRNHLSPTKKSAFGSSVSGQETPVSWAFTECPSVIEMELCEEYTCVISHGPNPNTTHIFGDCIVESCKGVLYGSTKKSKDRHESFLNLCFTCKKSLEKGSDIYMYRGEQAFCSEECRNQEMIKV